MSLRPYQQQLADAVEAAFAIGHRAVMFQSATGSGKTVVLGHLARRHDNSQFPDAAAIAHRSELVGQLSQQLAREGITHDIVANAATVRECIKQHILEYGRTFHSPRARWHVASVDTMIRRQFDWYARCGLAFIDEGHHVLRENKWGRAVAMLPNARIVLPTATPIRADGKGLGSHADGIADVLIEGPSMRALIDAGYLTDYRIIAIKPKDLMLDDVPISASGDFSPEKLRDAVHASSAIVGDVVDTYIKHARGKLGVTFAVDIEHARDLTQAFNDKGVPAALITGEDSQEHRNVTIRRFRNRELMQLVNVDLFGEGFDLPAIECVSFARPTASFALYTQQWGRALRLMIAPELQAIWGTLTDAQRLAHIAASPKPHAFIFDHAGNFYRHLGPPDKPRTWSLDRRNKRASTNDGAIPVRICTNPTCARVYERYYVACPYCGLEPPIVERSSAEIVDGDLVEISPELLARYMGEIARIDGPVIAPTGLDGAALVALRRNWSQRQASQHALREAIAHWAGTYPQFDNRVNSRRFFFTFGIDVLQAQTLSSADADSLRARIIVDMNKRGYTL